MEELQKSFWIAGITVIFMSLLAGIAGGISILLKEICWVFMLGSY